MVGKHRALWRLLAVLLAFSLIAAACGGDDDDDAADDGQTEATDDGGSDDGAASDDDGAASDDSGDDGAATDDGAASDDSADDDGAIVTEAEDDSELTPVSGGTLRFGIPAEVDGLNSAASSLSASGLTMANAVYDTLAAWTPDGRAVPWLAESFTPNEDFTSWTVKLREGITFHDGTPLNAAAVEVNFLSQLGDPIVGIAVAPFFPPADQGAVEVIDDLTIQFNLLEPNAVWPGAVAGQLGMVASPTWLAAALEDPTLNQEPVGTGPFVFESRSQDSVTRFVRNDGWWGGEVYLDAVEFVPVTDSQVRAQLLLEDELNALTATDVGAIEVLVGDDSLQNVLDDTGEESFAMINSANPPFDDIRARQALTFSTPRDNYNTLIGLGVNTPASQMFTPQSPFHNPDVVSETDQPDLAGPLVEAYCGDFPDNCSDGKINMTYQFAGPSVVGTRISELLNEGWEPYFNVSIDEVPQDTLINNAIFGLYSVTAWRQFGAVDPALDNVWLLCRTVGGISLNFPKFCDEERDALLLQAQATTDLDERVPIYQDVVERIAADYLYIFYNHTLWDIALAPEVRNLCGRTSPEGEPLRCSINGRTFYSSAFLSE